MLVQGIAGIEGKPVIAFDRLDIARRLVQKLTGKRLVRQVKLPHPVVPFFHNSLFDLISQPSIITVKSIDFQWLPYQFVDMSDDRRIVLMATDASPELIYI